MSIKGDDGHKALRTVQLQVSTQQQLAKIIMVIIMV